MRSRTALVAAGLVVVGSLLLAAVLIRSRGGQDDAQLLAQGPATPASAGWSGGFELRVAATDLWFAAPVASDRVLLVGGPVYGEGPAEYLTELTLVSPASGRSSMVPAPPSPHPLAFVSGLARGDTVFLLGKSCQRFDEGIFQCVPGTYEFWEGDLDGSWRQLDLPQRASGNLRADGFTIVGSPVAGELVARLHRQDGPDEFWSYDLAERAWSALPVPPVSARQACAAGGRTALLEHPDVHSGGPGGVEDLAEGDVPRVALYDHATRQWLALPTPPVAPALIMRIACAGSHVVVTSEGGGALHAASFDTRSSAWASSAAPVSAPFAAEDRTVVWNGDELIAWDPSTSVGLAYRPAANAWRQTPGGPASSATVAMSNGHVVVVAAPAQPGRRALVYRYVPSPDQPQSERPLASAGS